MRKKPLWQAKARKEYETSDLSLEEIAKKFEKSQSSVRQLSAKEGWAKNQAQNCTEVAREIEQIKQEIIKEATAELRSDIKSKFYHLIKEEEELKQRLKVQRMRRAFGTIQDIYDANGNLKSVADLTEDEAPLVAGIKVTDKFSGKGDDFQQWTEKEYKLISNDKDLEALEKMMGMYENYENIRTKRW